MPQKGRVITRTRPALSCVQCKLRKVKCDRQQPACHQCRRSKDTCHYEPFPPVRAEAANQEQSLKRPRPSRHQSADVLSRSVSSPQNGANGTGGTQPLGERQPQSPSPGGQQEQSETQEEESASRDARLLQGHAYGVLPQADSMDSGLSTLNMSNSSTSASLDQDMAAPMYDQGLISDEFLFIHNPSATPPSPQEFDQLPDATFDLGSQLNPYPASSAVQKWTQRQTDASAHFPSSALKQVPPAPEGTKLSECLSSPQRGLRRYVSSPFWALAGNRVAECNLLLQAQQSNFQRRQRDPSRLSEQSKILRSLPPKRLCDALLDSFFLNVRPLLPLVHGPSFRANYLTFWTWFAADRGNLQVEDMDLDVSFPCLLWAVLFCGAVAASPAFLDEASCHVRDQPALISRLRNKLDMTMALSNFARLPTLNGLVAFLITHECDPFVDEIVAAGPFVAQCIQAAKTLGIQHEETVISLGEADSEIARRVWYHIIYLEVLATISSGSSLSSNSHESSYTTRMPHEYSDAHLGSRRPDLNSPNPYPPTSTAILIAIGRYEMCRVMRHIVEHCFENTLPNDEDLGALINEIEQFEHKIEGLAARLVVRGLPDQGHISGQLLRANPLHDRKLYEDNPYEENVFNAFASITLSMLKDYVSILFNRRFLSQASDHQSAGIWRSEISTCIHFLKNYLNLARLPAFRPYHWFCPGKIQPLQECMIVLTYFKNYPQGNDAHLLRYLLNEVFDIFKGRNGLQKGESTFPVLCRYEASWQLLQQMRDEVFAGIDKSTAAKAMQANPDNLQQRYVQPPRLTSLRPDPPPYSPKVVQPNFTRMSEGQAYAKDASAVAMPPSAGVSSGGGGGLRDLFDAKSNAFGAVPPSQATRTQPDEADEWLDLVDM